ncbi:hypothetical protein E2C01_102241 [Portunus trituberculatus]|uniref:Uncharacterized protein n=1 Tax=Portunus trituberculatus TaxID=210409 RepID=A0A5B7KI12_PORTR|nr:hypothetical protein [Portunus trituberculatus]
MVVLLGLSRETNERMIEAVKKFLERMWRARCTDGAADPKARFRSDPESPVVSRSRSRRTTHSPFQNINSISNSSSSLAQHERGEKTIAMLATILPSLTVSTIFKSADY